MFTVQSFAHVLHTILQDGGTTEILLCEYKHNNTWEHVQSADNSAVVRTSTKQLKLHHKCIDPVLDVSHSLREGGAMALKFYGYDYTTIKTFGRWNILTFLQYMHNQIIHISKDFPKKMSIALPFLNIAAIEGLHY